MKASSKKLSPITAIFITVFIDMLGIGLIIPIFAPLMVDNQGGLFAADSLRSHRNIVYGFMVATFAIFQFFGAPILGALADRHGRKRILLLTLVGTLSGYVLYAGAIHFKLLWLLFVARAIPGFMGGNISIALAALADISEGKEKAKNFALVGMAFGMGMIFGPFIGGILSKPTAMFPWLDFSVPFIFSAALTGLNIFYVVKQFPETFTPSERKGISFFTGFKNVFRAFQLVNLRVVLFTVFLHAFGFSFFMQFNSVFLLDKFHFDQQHIGLFFGYIGIWIALVQGLISRRAALHFTPAQTLRVSLIGLAVALFCILLPSEWWMLLLINPFVALFQGLTQPNTTALVSSLASREEQGEVMGIQQSMASLAFAIPPIIAGFVVNIDYRLPIAIASLFMLLGWLVFFFGFREKKAI